jgi:hypothetical protein
MSQHGLQAEDTERHTDSAKVARIQDIRSAGLEHEIWIVRYGLTLAEYTAVEAAVIDVLASFPITPARRRSRYRPLERRDELTNRRREDAHGKGVILLDRLVDEFAAPPLTTTQPLLLITLRPWEDLIEAIAGNLATGSSVSGSIRNYATGTRAFSRWRRRADGSSAPDKCSGGVSDTRLRSFVGSPADCLRSAPTDGNSCPALAGASSANRSLPESSSRTSSDVTATGSQASSAAPRIPCTTGRAASCSRTRRAVLAIPFRAQEQFFCRDPAPPVSTRYRRFPHRYESGLALRVPLAVRSAGAGACRQRRVRPTSREGTR